MDKSEVNRMLAELGSRPLRGRSQNFLLDDSVVRAAADAVGISPGDNVVEVGPGLGVLTEELLNRGARVVAVELDPKLAAWVSRKWGNGEVAKWERGKAGARDSSPHDFAASRLLVIQADVLDVSSAELVSLFGSGSQSYKVASNLPYSITSRFLEKFLVEQPRPISITAMLQREVADRITAGPGGMSLLSVIVQSFAEPKIVVRVPPSSFFPPPEVQSAVVHIRLKSEPEIASQFRDYPQDRFFSGVKLAFSQKRKKLRNTLSPLFQSAERLENAFNVAKISVSARPEELSVADWHRLFDQLKK